MLPGTVTDALRPSVGSNTDMKDWGVYLPHGNPVARMRVPDIPAARAHCLVGDEEFRLQDAAAPYGGEIGPILCFAIERAMRRGEIAAMQWPMWIARQAYCGSPIQVTRGEWGQPHGHRGALVWLTGLPGSGKSTLAYTLERRLYEDGRWWCWTVIVSAPGSVRISDSATPIVASSCGEWPKWPRCCSRPARSCWEH